MSGPRLANGAIALVASIDTEEDNWRPTRDDIRIENIRALPALQLFLRGLGLRPTYFVDHPVASEPWSAAILREIAESGEAEIGAHLHPWNTPPLEEALLPRHSMLANLPAELQRRKLCTLRDALTAATGHAPTSFRAGRFGLGPETVTALVASGFRVDSSVTPWIGWQEYDGGPDFRGAPQGCYRLGAGGDPRIPSEDGPLLELPLSSGFTRRPFGWRAKAYDALRAPALRRFSARPVGFAAWHPAAGDPESGIGVARRHAAARAAPDRAGRAIPAAVLAQPESGARPLAVRPQRW